MTGPTPGRAPGAGEHLSTRHVLHEANIAAGTSVLDCGCGAGRFVRLAADRGAKVAGIDAANALVEIAHPFCGPPRRRLRIATVAGSHIRRRRRVQHLPVCRRPRERTAREARVSRGSVWVAIPTRLADSGIPQAFASLIELFPAEAPVSLRQSGMYALSAPERLEELLEATGSEHGPTTSWSRQSPSPTSTPPCAPSSAPERPP